MYKYTQKHTSFPDENCIYAIFFPDILRLRNVTIAAVFVQIVRENSLIEKMRVTFLMSNQETLPLCAFGISSVTQSIGLPSHNYNKHAP